MTKENIIKLAAGGILPREVEMTCPERALFYTLKDIYDQYRKGIISKSNGESMKNKAMRQFDLDDAALKSALIILRQNAQLWQTIETAGSAYRQNRTLENADVFISTVYGVRMAQKEENNERAKEFEQMYLNGG